MLSLSQASLFFDRGVERAKTVIAIAEYFGKLKPEAMSCDDLLRSAIVCSSSAFDLFHHQAFRSLMLSRLLKGNINIPYVMPTAVVHLSPADALPLIDKQIRDVLAHRSFLMPDKISELYSPVIPNFWTVVAAKGKKTDDELKARIKQLGKWRNRIVHESDINPDLSGIEEWPILLKDVISAVDDYQTINNQIRDSLYDHL